MSSVRFACKRVVWGDASRLLRVLWAAMAVFLICAPLFSQGSQGTIEGGIFDQSGGAIAGAMVTVTDVARGVARNLVADDAGQYTATSLNPGTYTIRAESKGFKTAEHAGVLLEVGQTIRVDMTLQPGEQSQTVTVTGEVPAVNTSDATLGGTVSNESINALPLNGRNFERLLQLRPGVVVGVGAGTGSESTNGMRTGEDLTLIEGLSQISPSTGASVLNASYRTGDASSLLPIDAIQEFNTEQNPKAEYGWKAGSVIDVGVKSGTNTIHGAAWAFGRDASATDASNYFSTPGTPGVTPATLEQFGATAGGRIIKDKLFWFLGYEGLRTTLGDVTPLTIPTDVALPGSGGKSAGLCTTIAAGNCALSMVDACNDLTNFGANPAGVNPLSAQLAGLNTTTCVVTAANNSPTGENLFPFITNANGSYSAPIVTTGPLNNGFVKSDYIVGQHSHVTGMYYVSKSTQQVAYATGTIDGQLTPQWTATVPAEAQMFNGTWTWTPSSTWVNDFRGGLAYVHNLTVSADVNKNPANPWPAGYGLTTGVDVNSNPQYGGMPEIDFSTFTGYLGAGKRTGVRGPEGTLDFVDNVSHLRGKHGFKFGFEFMDSIYDNNNYNIANGEVKFSSLESFLTGKMKSGKIFLGNPDVNVRQHSFAGFFQDDWRVTTKITLNLGLRYEYTAAPVERNNFIGNFNPNVTGTTPALEQAGPGAPLSSLYHPYRKAFSPRVGLAWDVQGNGKTVVRVGASVLDSQLITSELVNFTPFGANFPGFSQAGTAASAHSPVSLSGTQALNPLLTKTTWAVGVPVFNTAFAAGGITCSSASPCPTAAVNPNFRTPYVAEWNLDIQRAITKNLTFDVAYVGNHGFAEGSEADINQPAIGAGYAPGGAFNAANCIAAPTTSCAPDTTLEAEAQPYYAKFPYLSQIGQTGNLDFSTYNALQATVSERAAHGLSFIAGYTYSHALDLESSSSISQNAYPLDTYDPRLGYGPTSSDIRNRFTFAPTYVIPGMKSPGQILEGWSVSSLLTLQTGTPWSPNDTTNDLTGSGEVNGGVAAGAQTWNYSGPRSAFKSGPHAIPFIAGNVAAVAGSACYIAAAAPYGGPTTTSGQLAIAALTNFGCYSQNGGILTPPAFGTIGNASRNLFGSPAYYNVDLSLSKIWKFKERYSAQFRMEFFNLFNRADFPIPTITDPSKAGFGNTTQTPDAANPVLGSGGPRHIQFGLKLVF